MTTETPDPNPAPPPRWADVLSGRLGFYALILNLSSSLFALDTFIIATIMPSVLADIGGARFYSWTVMLYITGAICGSASAGPARAILGRRRGYVLSILLFLVGVLGASSSTDILTLTAWRLIEGIAGGLIIGQTMALVSDLYPPQLRTRIFSLIGTVWGAALVIGPAIGGTAAYLGSWRGAFWAMAPIAVLSAWLAWRSIPPFEEKPKPARFPTRRLVLLATSVMSLGMMSQTGGTIWRIALALGAFALLAGVIRLDARAGTKMFPSRPLAPWTIIGAAFWIILLIGIATTFINVFATLFLQVLHGLDELSAGYFYTQFSIAWTASALLVAGFRGRAVWASIWVGLTVFVIGVVGIALFAVPGPLWLIGASLLVVGLGVGLSTNHIIERTLAVAPHEEEAITAASTHTMRSLGMAFGSALSGMIANDAGLGAGATPEIVARVVHDLYNTDIAIAVLVFLAGIPFSILYRAHSRRLNDR